MEVVVAVSPMAALHDTGRSHPERPGDWARFSVESQKAG